MKKECPLCKLNKEESAKLWRLFYHSPEILESTDIGISKKEINNHFATHRVQQAKSKPWSRQISLQAAKRLPNRLQKLLLLLQKNPGLSLEQITAIFYLKENPNSALRSASRDLKRLMSEDFIYRVFLENINGEGPRPRLDVPALFFLGTNSRSYIQEKTGQSPIKREEWLSESSDLYPWNKYYHLYLSRDIVKEIISQMNLENDRRVLEIEGWKISFNLLDWISPIAFSLNDPLQTFKKINADGVFALSFEKEKRNALLPFFYYFDRGSKSVEQMSQALLSHGALPRSRALPNNFYFFSQKTIAPVLCVSESPERRDELLAKVRGRSSPESSIIITESSSLSQGLDSSFWQNLTDGQMISLLKTALLVAGSSGVESDKNLQKISNK